MGFEYRESEGVIDPDTLYGLAEVARQVFDVPKSTPIEHHIDWLRGELNGYRWVHLCAAYRDDELVAYKVGRANDPRTFESWNGGVLQDFRRMGIAAELARRQADWCRAQGFQHLQTETAYDNQAMLIVNLKQGFHIQRRKCPAMQN